MIEILYQDKDIVVCIKPIGVESEDKISAAATQKKQAETMPALLRETLQLTENAPIFTVHRLDKQVSGVMVYAKTKAAAAVLSTQMQNRVFTKEYRAVVEGILAEEIGRWEDLLYHDKRKNKVFTVKKERKGVKHAALRYAVLGQTVASTGNESAIEMPNKEVQPIHTLENSKTKNSTTTQPTFSLLKIELETGRTHQIRVQCASRTFPLIGDARYGSSQRNCDIALFSHQLGFYHPNTKKWLTFTKELPDTYPWNLF